MKLKISVFPSVYLFEFQWVWLIANWFVQKWKHWQLLRLLVRASAQRQYSIWDSTNHRGTGDSRGRVPHCFSLWAEKQCSVTFCVSLWQYEFSLENWVLTGLQSGSTGQHLPLPSSSSSSSSGLLPSCPPYWMMFSSPQQSRLASGQSPNHGESNLQQHPNTSSTTSASAGRGESVRTQTSTVTGCSSKERASDQRGQRKAFVPSLLDPPACLSSLPHRRRKNLRQCSLSALETTTQHDPKAFSHSHSPSSHRPSSTKTPATRANSVHRLPSSNNHKVMVTDKDFNICAPVFFFSTAAIWYQRLTQWRRKLTSSTECRSVHCTTLHI